MTKIVGFLITKENKIFNIDFFNVGLRTLKLEHNGYYVFLWGIGDIDNYKINNKYFLSFPINNSLLDRNVLIYLEDENIIIENDWLGSIPVFYNPKEKIVSTLSNLCLKDKTISHEGLANFCEFGYSVFEQTMFEDVKFMRYFSKLIITSNGIKIEYKNDPIHDPSFLDGVTTPDDVIAQMKDYLGKIEKFMDGDIIIPTSGGYDSRMLNYLVDDKSRIRSFTYGISKDQSLSTEVVHAKKLSEIYKTKWEQIELNSYHKYIDDWFKIYGFSTHLHGMYHIEFYHKILEKRRLINASFLSGIIGDAWAEFGKFKNIESFQDLSSLGYAHGMNLDLKHLAIVAIKNVKERFYDTYESFLKNDRLRSIYAMRTKLMLLSYLTQIPEYFGLPVWTPFLNFDIVKATLNLPEDQRINRRWEKDFFKKVGLNLEEMHLKSVKSNELDYEVAKRAKLEPIDVDLMARFIKRKRLVEINRYLSSFSIFERIKNQLLYIPKIGGALRRLGVKNDFLRALYEYYIIKAIEKGLKYEP